jgi:protein-tyrosine phosphatase
MSSALDFSRPAPNTRIEPLDGPLNFRDLGGYAIGQDRVTRRGQLFRSDGHETLSVRDADRLIEELGIRAVIDLRTADEVARSGPSMLSTRGVQMHHIPIIDQTKKLWENGDTKLSAVYLTMLRDASTRFVATVELLANLDGPTVFHCAAGKDRTGLVAAMVLDLLGVTDDDIADDYAVTAHIMPAMRKRFDDRLAHDAELRKAMEANLMPVGLRDEMMSARASTMKTVLAIVGARHGSLSGWLLRNGLDLSVGQSLSKRLIA